MAASSAAGTASSSAPRSPATEPGQRRPIRAAAARHQEMRIGFMAVSLLFTFMLTFRRAQTEHPGLAAPADLGVRLLPAE